MAVVDGPDGTLARQAPADRNLAIELRLQHANGFWCSTLAGGCGGTLLLAAGAVLRPHFRHRGEVGSCALARDPARAERSYEHVRYQRVLLDWLTDQGLSGRAEHTMGSDGRADLHVLVDGVAHSIEVQLSPLNDRAWLQRDEKYRRRVRHVTWLYGPLVDAAAAREQAVRGIALRVRGDVESGDVEIGVQGHTETAWAPLSQCRLPADGFWTPHLLAAQREHERVLRQRAEQVEHEARERLECERAARVQRERVARERSVRRQAALARVTRAALPLRPVHEVAVMPPDNNLARGGLAQHEGAGGSASAAAVVEAARWPRSTAEWRELHPEADEWSARQDWSWLAVIGEPYRKVVQFLAYLTQRIYLNGPTAMFDLPDTSNLEEVLVLMQRAGLIRRFERAGVERWERAG
ncbi:hypothetical protein MO973_09615 [Paenibacillus sp. TRM 82003]|uniref:competence protein CoiA family protein n=1 Tax=Kineococcus sp. TRM81007 TaxID=2925831 RepID=UPI001F579F64|nr:competence protein CoiA family protein [Kineococcus sp. TRM81007]MCI2238104.1 hypothetical protein [Kineococcus sp. TRM81007]MCI3920489.1 hypothetical protein [Paenibacillus sp. TRM 82003]